jgi:hypothetical protein
MFGMVGGRRGREMKKMTKACSRGGMDACGDALVVDMEGQDDGFVVGADSRRGSSNEREMERK